MSKPTPQPPKLELRLEGPAVAGRISVDMLASLAKELQTSLRRMAAARKRAVGRFRTEVEQACTLDLVGFSEGSAVLDFEYAGQRDRANLYGDPGISAAEDMLKLMQRAEIGEPGWDADIQPGVIEGWETLSKPLGDGVDSMCITLVDGQSRRTARLTHAFRENLRRADPARLVIAEGQIEGVLWECDWKLGTAQLDEADGNRVPLMLREGLDERVTQLRRQRVRVSGRIERVAGRTIRVAVTDVVPAGAAVGDPDPRFGGFWDNLSLDEIAARQGVQPATQLDAFAIQWPDDESVEDFLASVRESRRA